MDWGLATIVVFVFVSCELLYVGMTLNNKGQGFLVTFMGVASVIFCWMLGGPILGLIPVVVTACLRNRNAHV